MNRMFQAGLTLVAAAGTFGSVGCMHSGRPGVQERYAEVVDPCWPERYNAVARQEVLAPFAAQVANGTVVDQTIFNYHFEPGTDKLTPGGYDKLDYLARRRPAPDSRLYLQTTRDVSYDAAKPEVVGTTRADLDAKRIAAVHKYLTASVAPRQIAFEVQVIDTPDLSIRAEGPANAVRGYPTRFQSGIGGVSSNNLTGIAGGMQGGTAGGTGGAPAGGQR